MTFAGLMAGLFAPLGKVALILVFILANAIGSLPNRKSDVYD
ncbi:MAG: hypothetical protein ACLTE2_07300 [Eubacteriales bacterium]